MSATEQTGSHRPASGGLKVSGLHKSFGARRVLQGIDLEVEAGQIFGFVGSNGAGKTTTMRAIMGILDPDQGQITLQGRALGAEARARIGYMPEERGLYPKMKVGEQLTYLARLHGMSKSAAQAAMEKWTERLGVAERRADQVEKLSLGNQQRVQLASALIFDPIALILDEPFSGLDPVAVDVMSSVLREAAAAGVPVIFSSHQLELVENLCDKVGILAGGKMVAQGTVPQLRQAASQAATRFEIASHARADFHAAAAAVGATLQETEGPVEAGYEWFYLPQPPSSQTVVELVSRAMSGGYLREFGPLRPSLTELYRNLINPTEAQGE